MNTSFERTEKSDDWITPPWLMKHLGEFDLDPCSCEPQPFPYAKNTFSISTNGLAQSWGGENVRVWCNPPYGRGADAFIEKLSKHGNGLLLIFARTETRTWFNHIWPKAHGILFLKGRLKFHRPNGQEGDSAGAPSALIAYGQHNADILKSLSGTLGHYVALRSSEKGI